MSVQTVFLKIRQIRMSSDANTHPNTKFNSWKFERLSKIIVKEVLSCKMGPAQIGHILKVFIKGRGAEIFIEFCLPLCLWEPFKFTVPPRPVISYEEPDNGAHSSECAVGFTSYKDWQRHDEKIWNPLPKAEWTFLLSFFIFQREWPRWILHAFVNSWKTRIGDGTTRCKWKMTIKKWRSIF
jgi:hypothetical protein